MAKKPEKKSVERKKIDIDKERLIEKFKLNSENGRKKTEKGEEHEEESIKEDFSFVPASSSRKSLDNSLKEDENARQLDEPNRANMQGEREKKKDEEEIKKVYESIYEAKNRPYEERRRDYPEMAVNLRFVNATEFDNFTPTPQLTTHMQRMQIVRDERMARRADAMDAGAIPRYEAKRIRDHDNFNPANAQLDIKEKNYKV